MKKVALRLEYAIKNLKSERLNENQVYALAEAIKVLGKSGGAGKEELQKILLDAGIFTVPKIEGLAELYADEYEQIVSGDNNTNRTDFWKKERRYSCFFER